MLSPQHQHQRVLAVHPKEIEIEVSGGQVDKNKRWAIYLEFHYGKAKAITPMTEGSILARSSRSLLGRKKNSKTKLTGKWTDWYCILGQTGMASDIEVTAIVKNGPGKAILTASRNVDISSIGSSSVRVEEYTFSGESCNFRLSLGLSLQFSEEVQLAPAISKYYRSLIQDTWLDQGNSSDEHASYASDSSDASAVHNKSFRFEIDATSKEKQAIVKLRQQILEEGKEKQWQSLIRGPLDNPNKVTFNKKQMMRIFKSIGASCSSKEYAAIFQYLAGEDRKIITLASLEGFLREIYDEKPKIRAGKGGHEPEMHSDEESNASETNHKSRKSMRGRASSDDSAFALSPKRSGSQKKLLRSTSPRKRQHSSFDQENDHSLFNDRATRRSQALSSYASNNRSLDNKTSMKGSKSANRNRSTKLEVQDLDTSETPSEFSDSEDEFQEDFSTQAIAELRHAILAKNGKLRDSMNFFAALLEDVADVPGKPHYITVNGFDTVLQRAGVSITPKTRKEILHRLDRQRTEQFSWKSLLHLLRRGDGFQSTQESNQNSEQATILIQKLQKRMQDSKLTISEPSHAFQLFDTNKLGHVSYNDARRALELLECEISKSDLQVIALHLQSIDPSTPKGRINYKHLLQLLNIRSQQSRSMTSASRATLPAQQLDACIQKIETQLMAQCEGTGQYPNLLETFQTMDVEGSGTVNFLQFTSGLFSLGIILSNDDLQVIALQCQASDAENQDKRHRYQSKQLRGRVDYRIFESLVNTEKLLAASLKPQMQRASARGLNPWSLFRAIDVNITGEISKADFRQICVNSLMLRVKERELRTLFKKFGNSQTHRVNYVDFLNFVFPDEPYNDTETLSGMETKLRNRLQLAYAKNSMRMDEIMNMQSSKKRSTHVPAKSIFQNLEKMSIFLNKEEKAILAARFDPLQEGFIDRAKFLDFTGFNEVEMDRLASRILKKLRQLTHQGVDYNVAFIVFDPSGKGSIPRREFRIAIRDLGVSLNEAELVALMKRFAQFDNPDLIHYRSFLNFVVSRQQKAMQRMDTYAMDDANRERHLSLKKESLGKKHALIEDQRLSVNGSGYDGLHSNRAHDEFYRLGRFASKDTQKQWKTRGSPNPRKAIRDIGDTTDAIALYTPQHPSEDVHSHDEDEQLFYDHNSKTVNRIIDHRMSMPEIQNTLHGKKSDRKHDASNPDDLSNSLANTYLGFPGVPNFEIEFNSGRYIADEDAVLRSIVADTFTSRRHSKKRNHRSSRERSQSSSSRSRRDSSSSASDSDRPHRQKSRHAEEKENDRSHRRRVPSESPSSRSSDGSTERNHSQRRVRPASRNIRSRAQPSSESDSDHGPRSRRETVRKPIRRGRSNSSSSNDDRRKPDRTTAASQRRPTRRSRDVDRDDSSSEDFITRDIGRNRMRKAAHDDDNDFISRDIDRNRMRRQTKK